MTSTERMTQRVSTATDTLFIDANKKVQSAEADNVADQGGGY
ncbi:hypothetical protein [Mycolicibacterium neoaurum]|nr:hypothetical protein [Mycolicibacterium neoaurum]